MIWSLNFLLNISIDYFSLTYLHSFGFESFMAILQLCLNQIALWNCGFVLKEVCRQAQIALYY